MVSLGKVLRNYTGHRLKIMADVNVQPDRMTVAACTIIVHHMDAHCEALMAHTPLARGYCRRMSAPPRPTDAGCAAGGAGGSADGASGSDRTSTALDGLPPPDSATD